MRRRQIIRKTVKTALIAKAVRHIGRRAAHQAAHQAAQHLHGH
jgi:hypothetical protein